MATNVYFSQKVRSEQNLYEDIVIESLKMYGQDVYYLPRTIVSKDTILNEDIESNFDDAYIIEMYIANIDGFEGDGNLLSKFGVEIRDQANFIVSRRRWEQYIGSSYSEDLEYVRPMEGDLIYLPLSGSLFEVRFVEHESPFYQISNLPTYTLQCELFEYSGETINTGISELDNINAYISQQTTIILNNGNGINFNEYEDVRQEIAGEPGEFITGRVTDYTAVDSTTSRLIITDWATTNGKVVEFQVDGSKIVGLESGAEWDIVNVYGIEDDPSQNQFINDDQARNQEFEVVADGIIDFSESNPFGEIGD
jgi:hypothetical protein